MLTALVTIDPSYTIGPVRRRTFGSFIEHIGRCIYGGVYQPDHPRADADGFRTDVIDLAKELGVSVVRYPGGNFVSGYRWEDGIGPRDGRPARLDLAWHSTEPNLFGLDEFVRWAQVAGVEPMMAINLGTRGVQEAVDLLEYCNISGGTKLSDLRRRNGAPEPHNIKLWCLGNEMDGEWQIGHKTAEEYARLATETARAMRMIDPDLLLVACGSSNSKMATFGEWERVILEEAYDLVDMVSAHAYYYEQDGDIGSFLASSVDMDHMIDTVVATADLVKDHKGSPKQIGISFDEWNVWYQTGPTAALPTGDNWPVAPRLNEDRYSITDAVVVGSLLISLLRHTDRVEAACLAQLVNVIAPIVTEPDGRIWRQTTFHPFAQTSGLARGEVLNIQIASPLYQTRQYGDAPIVDATATWDAETGSLVVFAVNRSQSQPVDLAIDVRSLPHLIQAGATSFAEGSQTTPQTNDTVRIADGTAHVIIPPVSWNVVTIRRER